MLSGIEKGAVSVFLGAFVLLQQFNALLIEYRLDSEAALEVSIALAPLFFIIGLSCYYHCREVFEDHFRLILSAIGFPAFVVGIKSLSIVSGGV
jgi:hypothetical protein